MFSCIHSHNSKLYDFTGRNFLKQLRRFSFFVLIIEYEITDCQRKLKDKGVLILKKPLQRLLFILTEVTI